MAHSKWVVQLKVNQKKRKAITDNLAMNIMNEHADRDLSLYLKQKHKDKLFLVEKDDKPNRPMTYYSTHTKKMEVGLTSFGCDNLATQFEEFQQF